MATFVILLNWTDQGIKSVTESTARADAAQELMGSFGVTMTDVYWTLGGYDVVSVVEAPDAEAVTAVLLKLGSMGNVRSTTLHAFTRDEFNSILAKAS